MSQRPHRGSARTVSLKLPSQPYASIIESQRVKETSPIADE